MSSAAVRLAELRLKQAQFWQNAGASLGDWTNWGALRRTEEVMLATINLIRTRAEGRPLNDQEVAQIKELMGQIAQNRVNHIKQTVAQPGTREYYAMREEEYQLRQLLAFEEEVRTMRSGNRNNNQMIAMNLDQAEQMMKSQS